MLSTRLLVMIFGEVEHRRRARLLACGVVASRAHRLMAARRRRVGLRIGSRKSERAWGRLHRGLPGGVLGALVLQVVGYGELGPDRAGVGVAAASGLFVAGLSVRAGTEDEEFAALGGPFVEHAADGLLDAVSLAFPGEGLPGEVHGEAAERR